MIRRTVLASAALVVLGGVATPALADTIGAVGDSGGRHYLCVLGNESPGAPSKGICVWVPTS